MSQSDDILARANDVLERHRVRDQVTRGVKNGARRIRNAGIAGIAVLTLAFVYGTFIGSLGVTGVLATGLLFLLAITIAIFWSIEPRTARAPEAKSLPAVPLARLPSQTQSWLAGQRLALPAPARTLADSIGVKLAALSDQLQAIPDETPAATHVRRLLAEELPGLVEGYARVPTALRKEGIDGLSPDKQLFEGLDAVDTELTRMSEELARGHLEALATQGKYLEYKYRGDGITHT
jgi:hypothetical protein